MPDVARPISIVYTSGVFVEGGDERHRRYPLLHDGGGGGGLHLHMHCRLQLVEGPARMAGPYWSSGWRSGLGGDVSLKNSTPSSPRRRCAGSLTVFCHLKFGFVGWNFITACVFLHHLRLP